jgi:hypothetical protein
MKTKTADSKLISAMEMSQTESCNMKLPFVFGGGARAPWGQH